MAILGSDFKVMLASQDELGGFALILNLVICVKLMLLLAEYDKIQ